MNIVGALKLYCKEHGGTWSVCDDYESLVWHDESVPKPTLQELRVYNIAFLQHQENTKYRELRAAEYPPLDTQLDVMYNHGFDAWRKHIYSIKAKYPSPKGTVKPTFDNPLEPIEKRMTVIETQFETDMKHAKQEMADLQAAIIDTKGAIYAIKGFMMEIPNIQKQLNIIQEKLENKDATS